MIHFPHDTVVRYYVVIWLMLIAMLAMTRVISILVISLNKEVLRAPGRAWNDQDL